MQGWSFSCLTCTTRRLWLTPPLAPLLRATSTGSFRGGCWPSASPSPAASDVTLHPHMKPPLEGQSRPKASVFLPAGPSSCEEERRAAAEALGAFVPSCEPGGGFSSRQCQQGGQCWCVDPTGQELPGSRQRGDSLDCSECPAAAGGVLSSSSSRVEPPPLAPLLRQVGVPAAVLPCAATRSSTCCLGP